MHEKRCPFCAWKALYFLVKNKKKEEEEEEEEETTASCMRPHDEIDLLEVKTNYNTKKRTRKMSTEGQQEKNRLLRLLGFLTLREKLNFQKKPKKKTRCLI